MLGKHPKDMTNDELLKLFNVYDSGKIIMYEHQLDKAIRVIREMVRRGIAKREICPENIIILKR